MFLLQPTLQSVNLSYMNQSNIHPKIRRFGIPNCDSVKKARLWLDAKGITYAFQDFKKTPLTSAQLNGWCKHAAWETLLNKKSTTWRALPSQVQAGVQDQPSACALMLEYPSLVKRPVMWSEQSSLVIIGVQPTLWEQALG